MSEPRDVAQNISDDELERRYAQANALTSRQIGQLLHELRPSIDTGLAGEETQLLVDLLCVVLSDRKSSTPRSTPHMPTVICRVAGNHLVWTTTNEPTLAETPLRGAELKTMRERAHGLRQYVGLLKQIGENGEIRRRGYDPNTLRWVGRR